MKAIFKKRVRKREFLVFEKSSNYYSISYYDYPSPYYICDANEIEITSANSKNKAKKKLKIIAKAYEIGFRDGYGLI